MKRLRLAVALGYLALVPWAAAQERERAPLAPPEMLEGQRLIDRAAHFSIEAPPNWIWLAPRSEHAGFRNFAASNPSGGLGYAVNTGTLELAWTAENARDIQVGMSKKLREMGFQVELLTFGQTNVPVVGAYHFSWRVVLPQGATMYRFGYELKHNNRLLSFTCFAPENSEPLQFSSFVSSLHLF